MQVFLTGGTGFIGRPLTSALLRRGWNVTALVRDPASREAQALKRMGAALVKGDVLDSGARTMRGAMRGAQVVIHNAGVYEIGITLAAAARMRAVNVQGTENVLRTALELGIPKVVYTSSIIAMGDTGGLLADENFQRCAPPLTRYEESKAEAHAIACAYQARGAPLVIVCPGQVIGPGDHSAFGQFARLYVRGLLPPAAWAPEAVFSMPHVDDVAEAMALAAERGQPGQSYILGGGQITMREMLDVWKRTPGGLKPFIWLPRPLALLNGLLAAPLLRLARQPVFFSREGVASAYVCARYSSAKAEQALGAHFRSPEQAWLDTLAAERDARRPPAA